MIPHRLELNDRGLGHVHRWLPSCVCGWRGVQRRRKQEAELQYAQHLAAEEGIDKRRRRIGDAPKPASVTPRSDLPEALR